jgi:hypothetical protein
MSKKRPFKVVPFPDGTIIKNNYFTIRDPIYDPNDVHENYDHVGDYIITASSFADDKHKPFNAFNGGKTGSWKTNYKKNPYIFKSETDGKVYDYCQNPYFTLEKLGDLVQTIPSNYQGGGSQQTVYSTLVGVLKNRYGGEWIQIQLPDANPIYLFRYSIRTPSNKDLCTHPKSFLLLGSKDGKTWQYIDMQVLALTDAPKYTGLSSSVVYEINSTDYFYYFRFVITEMFPGNGVLEISQISLFTFLEHTPNPNAVEEGFMNRTPNQINYSNFQLSSNLPEIFPTIPTDIVPYEDKKLDDGIQIQLVICFFLTILASSMFYYKLIKK